MYLRSVTTPLFRPPQGFPPPTTGTFYDELDLRSNVTALPCASSSSISSSSSSPSSVSSSIWSLSSSSPRRSPRRHVSPDRRALSESPSTARTSPATSPAPPSAFDSSSGAGKQHVTDSPEAFPSTQMALLNRFAGKTAGLAARQGKRPSSVPRTAWTRIAASGSAASNKARKRASTAAVATSAATSDTDSHTSEADDAAGRLAHFSPAPPLGPRRELVFDDDKEEPKPKAKAVCKSRKLENQDAAGVKEEVEGSTKPRSSPLEEEALPGADPSSSPLPSPAKKVKSQDTATPTPAPRGYRKQRAEQRQRTSRRQTPAVNSEPETVCIPLVKPDASGATWFPIKPGTSEPQLLDSKEKMFAAQEFFLDYVQQKRAELAARPSERRERVSPYSRTNGSLPNRFGSPKARKPASPAVAAAATSGAASETDSDQSEADDAAGRFAPFSGATAHAARSKITELDSDDDEEELEQESEAEAVSESSEGEERAGGSKTSSSGSRRRSPSLDDEAHAVFGAGAAVQDDPMFRGVSID
ncbi:hypothetical protein BMF94_0204 [Rhodotorula taiwanensis]|uniref:Uncharacterized protein n=1 Tax=Rhodotorula taiwanensis TaxID=741276 RepID=A0A2S5BIN3_9BASI|nr:hypothetical protein BMF94_0204 [Rhodotorula taiwanensis]